jgi:hypothetical protein
VQVMPASPASAAGSDLQRSCVPLVFGVWDARGWPVVMLAGRCSTPRCCGCSSGSDTVLGVISTPVPDAVEVLPWKMPYFSCSALVTLAWGP